MQEQPQRVLFATDVPFWEVSDGAQQRIMSLYRFLVGTNHPTEVFYLGTDSTREAIESCPPEIRLRPFTSADPPVHAMGRVRWFAAATIHQAREWLNGGAGATREAGPVSLRLEDFRWPWAMERFRETVEDFRPDVIIIEYVKLAYLLEALPPSMRQQMTCMVDTHDILHRRAEQFRAHGYPHWLDIDREQESHVLSQFDVILAIQPHEAIEFRTMVPGAEVLTVGHAPELAEPQRRGVDTNDATTLRVGYIGSKNFSNWSAIRQFINDGWPLVLNRHPDRCELVIAGAICQWIRQAPDEQEGSPLGRIPEDRLRQVRLMGHVPTIDEFYDQIDVLINPVDFGTGLKIKNAEALSFAKLLITTTTGFDGMPESTRLACMVVDSVPEMGEAINSLLNDLPLIRKLQSLALELSETEFSAQYAYAELADWFDRSRPTSRPE